MLMIVGLIIFYSLHFTSRKIVDTCRAGITGTHFKSNMFACTYVYYILHVIIPFLSDSPLPAKASCLLPKVQGECWSLVFRPIFYYDVSSLRCLPMYDFSCGSNDKDVNDNR